jgi:hypothetical protein
MLILTPLADSSKSKNSNEPPHEQRSLHTFFKFCKNHIAVMLRMCTFFLVECVKTGMRHQRSWLGLVFCHNPALTETPHVFSTVTLAMRLPIMIHHSHCFINLVVQHISCLESRKVCEKKRIGRFSARPKWLRDLRSCGGSNVDFSSHSLIFPRSGFQCKPFLCGDQLHPSSII